MSFFVDLNVISKDNDKDCSPFSRLYLELVTMQKCIDTTFPRGLYFNKGAQLKAVEAAL